MNKYLKDIFNHLDGIAMCPLYEILDQNQDNIIAHNAKTGFFFTNDDSSNLNEGYNSIIAKILQAQNILDNKKNNHKSKTFYKFSDYGKKIFDKNYSYEGFKDYYKQSLCLIKGETTINDKKFYNSFSRVASIYRRMGNYNKDEISLVFKHIEGAIIAPILVYYSYTKPELSINTNELKNEISEFLKSAGFIINNCLTEKGEYLLSKAYAYGVTESYMKTFIHIEDLAQNKLKGIANKIDSDNNEYHVNRALNVWGSGHSHTTYFKYIDNYVIDIFNQPLEKQPIGVADMGCGDGALLHHLNELIKTQTLRGKNLKSHPLLLIGADFNQAALDETNKMFSENSNKPMTVLADISKPDEYAQKIQKKYSLDISNFLNVRSFLDHNRRYDLSYQDSEEYRYSFNNTTNNAFCWRGVKINSQAIQVNLVNHFKKWKKYISKYGLLALELHSINIEEISKNIGKAPITAYVATHGFSDQFIIEYNVYKECINKAGLHLNNDYEKTFPSNQIKMISINLIS